MGMSIDEIEQWEKKNKTVKVLEEKWLLAQETMRKYQKICKILDRSDNGEQCMYDTIQEIEEVRDGNVD